MNIKLLKKLRKKAKRDFDWKIYKISNDKYILLHKVGSRYNKLYMIGPNKYSNNPHIREVSGLSKKDVTSIYKNHEHEFINIKISDLKLYLNNLKRISINKIL